MRGSGVIGSDWYLPLILPQWDAVGKGFWDMDVEEVPTEWGWLVLLSPAPRPDILAPEDSDTLGADTRTSSLTARRDLQAREAHSGQSRRPCWSSGVFGGYCCFSSNVPCLWSGHVCVWDGVAGTSREGTRVLGSATSSGPAGGRPNRETLLCLFIICCFLLNASGSPPPLATRRSLQMDLCRSF